MATTTLQLHFRLSMVSFELEGPSHCRQPSDTYMFSTFEIIIVNTIMTRSTAAEEIAAKPGPDLTVSGTIGSVLAFIPGVTAGIMGFIIFGTTSHFRRIYAQTLRRWICCGDRKNKNNTEDVERSQAGGLNGAGIGLSGRRPTYHCRVESLGANLQMGPSGRIGPVVEDKDQVIARAQEVLDQKATAKVQQPWRTLGIEPLYER